MSKIGKKFKFLASHARSIVKPGNLSRGTLFVTRRCDRTCSYCFTRKSDSEGELDLSEAKAVIDKFKELGIWYFSIFGGEPTLREDLPEIISYVHDSGMFDVLHTNGSFRNADVDDIVEAEPDIIALAIDSISNPNFKNYEEIKDNFERLVELYDYVLINHCIIKENCHEIDDMLGLAEQYGVPIIIHLGEHPPLPTDADYDPNAIFKQGDRTHAEQVKEIAAKLAEKARKSRTIVNPPEFFEACSAFMDGKEVEWVCRAGKNSLAIDYNGRVLPCVSATYPIEFDGRTLHYSDLNIGNINSVKARIQGLSEQCRPNCLSCIYMLEYFNMRNPLRTLKLVSCF